MLATILIILAAFLVAFALPLGSFVRLGILAMGLCLGIATTQTGRDVLILAGAMGGLLPTPNLSGPAPPADTWDSATITYRVTAKVRVNGAQRSGSSLQRVTIIRNITFGSNQISNIVTRKSGEAVAVPLTDESYLIVMMDGQGRRNDYDGLLRSPCNDIYDFRDFGIGRPEVADYIENAYRINGPCSVSPDRLPYMIIASDTSASANFISVSPNTLGAQTGESVEFVSLTFERVTEKLKYELDSIFDWLPFKGDWKTFPKVETYPWMNGNERILNNTMFLSGDRP